ncbi:NAD-dependent malic enzyme [Bacteriovorax sp. PP10]|uniref:NAD-dependent malic enzyme n=1 Tax=Bacteriovorax antarcticus TaxID=3088717 RepID=A0ABU5VV96_9BACT|nr:NAD-dependent malic enzyme [Bacteriovorax sp. PP10]MEA9356981.1 NAD-dependent malic enzyme [Bacteriovorax sp. PP10]
MKSNNTRPVPISYFGTSLLAMSLLNKGNAFSEEERHDLKLYGLLSHTVETIEEQAKRTYAQYAQHSSDIDKHIFLRDLQDTNETLFYYLLRSHLTEMLPIIYTPVVGEACERFSEIYRAARGLFISYPDRGRIDEMLADVTKKKVKVIVVTDGERILGLGDQGIGGIGISIGKLSLYTVCGGVSPAYTLPIVLDVGTNNERLLNDPLYMGWKHPRITGPEYEQFIDSFVQAVKLRWPDVLLQFEDFSQRNASPVLNRYRDQICCFNDDIQGTATVTLGTLIAASRAVGEQLRDQKIVFLGAGAAGCGIAEQIIERMKLEGLTEAEARSRVFMVDRFGLLTDNMPNILDFQANLAQKKSGLAAWAQSDEEISLLKTVQNVHPTVLIGVSAQPGLFTEEIVRTMHSHCARPIIMPLSNPTSRVEAHPIDLINWTNGAAVVATGSPFMPVHFNGKVYPIAQCNNSYIFPGIGLGVLAVRARKVTDLMLMAASEALADLSPLAQAHTGGLLPDLKDIEKVSRAIAFKVSRAAQASGAAEKISDQDLMDRIESNFWYPQYRTYTLKEK